MSPNAIPRCRKRETSGSCMSVAPSWFYNEAIARFEATQQIAWIAKIFAQFSNPFKGLRGGLWEVDSILAVLAVCCCYLRRMCSWMLDVRPSVFTSSS